MEGEANLRVKGICDIKWIVHIFIKDRNRELYLAYEHYFSVYSYSRIFPKNQHKNMTVPQYER